MGDRSRDVATKLLEGEPNRQRLKFGMPNLEPKLFMPKGLDPIAKRWWQFNIPQLVENGVATKIDSTVLEAAARTYSVWVRLTQQIDNHLDLSTPEASGLIRSAKTYLAQYMNIVRDYGLTNTSRNAITAAPPVDELAEFLGG